MKTLARPHLLVVDDDARLRELLRAFLRDQGFFTTLAWDTSEARRMLLTFRFDLMILDVMLPRETGIAFLKSSALHPPVLMLTAMEETEDRISGLEAGADDYLAKPFDPRELVLRVQSILRRTHSALHRQAISFGPFRFSLSDGRLTREGQPVALTASEAQLLRALAARAGTPVSREELARLMGAGLERSIDVQITRLRKKLESEAGISPIQTVRHAGYVLHGETKQP